jgi:hypothetical protein
MTAAAAFVLATVAVWVGSDVVFLATGRTTISVTVGDWMAGHLWVTAAVFALVGHLAASGEPRFSARHWLAAVLAFALAYFLTLLLVGD